MDGKSSSSSFPPASLAALFLIIAFSAVAPAGTEVASPQRQLGYTQTRNQEEWSRSERGPQEKGGEPAGLVTPLGWGRPGGELYTLELGGVRQL